MEVAWHSSGADWNIAGISDCVLSQKVATSSKGRGLVTHWEGAFNSLSFSVPSLKYLEEMTAPSGMSGITSSGQIYERRFFCHGKDTTNPGSGHLQLSLGENQATVNSNQLLWLRLWSRNGMKA